MQTQPGLSMSIQFTTSVRAVLAWCRKLTWQIAVLNAGLLWLLASAADAQLSLGSSQRAFDGTMYEVISVGTGPLAGGVDEMRVTTVAGGPDGLSVCSLPGGPSQPISAAGGANLAIPQTLHPYGGVLRSGILTPNDGTIQFDPTNGGRLTVGSGPGAITICGQPVDCIGAPNVTTNYTLLQNGGGVPSACIANGVSAPCLGLNQISTFGFGLPASGNPPVCDSAPTTGTPVCNTAPTNGFVVGKGQLIVFMYTGLTPSSGFSYAAGGFGIDQDGDSVCGVNRVVTSDAQAPSAPGYAPTRTPTPSLTPTPSQTNTPRPPEICNDGIDNDSDGLVDCDDVLDCHCTPIAQDPAHLCPKPRGYYRYTIHGRLYPSLEIPSLDTLGATLSIQFHGDPPWARFVVPRSQFNVRQVSRKTVIYRYRDTSSGLGLKKLFIRKTWVHGKLQYWVNAMANVTPPPRPGRFDIVQQLNVGDVPFASLQPWAAKKTCLFLSDKALPLDY